jgi:16S rRNA (cytosine967-C5)-methyltransferase
MATAARDLALRILLAAQEGPTLGDALAAPEALGLPARDRAFLHELVLGTLRHRGALDHALAPLLDRPLRRLEPVVLAALRLGAYQILRLRVPDRAAVSESVDLVRARAPRTPDPAADPLGWLTSEGSLPRWLAERWLTRLGRETALARARALLAPAPAAFRVSPRVRDAWDRLREAGVEAHPLAVPGAFETRGGRLTELAESAVVYLQDAGSQMIARLASRPGLVLDACAAPGGKAALLGDLAAEGDLVVAAEASPRRLATMRVLLARWGPPRVACVGADALHPPFRSPFDAVLLDAPCSGLGTLGRHPDIRWRCRPSDLARHSERQRGMLEALAALVRPGGRLVYAVCSLEPEETVEVLGSFLEARPEFRAAPLPEWAAPFAAKAHASTLPERHGGDGFFAAALDRR